MSSSSISHMQEFSSVTASSYDADALAPLLSEKSADGWDVVSIVSAGTNIVAYLSRATTGDTVESAAEVDTTIVPVPVDDDPVAEEPAATAAAPAESAVPAGWYADPSGRYELRYWDGNAWTEHVSRAGQQFTDPPVA